MILLTHEIFVAIYVGVSEFHIPECWGLNFSRKSLLPKNDIWGCFQPAALPELGPGVINSFKAISLQLSL